MQDQGLTAGRLVTFSTGAYSDYSYEGTFVALETVTMGVLREIAVKINASARESDDYRDRHSEFQAELIRRGYLLEVNNHEIHIGVYDELDLS